jgi:protein-serine/threonine kinase
MNTNDVAGSHVHLPRQVTIVQRLRTLLATSSLSWWQRLFHITPTSSYEERQMAQALHVSVDDLEDIVRPLRTMNLMHDDQFNWPSVHLGNIESRYGDLEEVVGHGTGGTVRLARTRDGKLLAVKEFRRRRTNESWKHYAECLTREYCISALLHHPNIIKTVDLIIDHDRFFEVMEHCTMDLFRYIERGGYSRREAYCCFKQIVYGVKYLHERNIAHLDLKPENICIDRNAQLKIIDFGLCTLCRTSPGGSQCKVRGLCGSVPYIAPEEWRQHEYDPLKVDIWSLGIILLTLVFRGFSWESATVEDIQYRAYLQAYHSGHADQYVLFQSLEDEARRLLVHMLDPNPITRYDIEAVISDPWFQYIASCSRCIEYRSHCKSS